MWKSCPSGIKIIFKLKSKYCRLWTASRKEPAQVQKFEPFLDLSNQKLLCVKGGSHSEAALQQRWDDGSFVNVCWPNTLLYFLVLSICIQSTRWRWSKTKRKLNRNRNGSIGRRYLYGLLKGSSSHIESGSSHWSVAIFSSIYSRNGRTCLADHW